MEDNRYKSCAIAIVLILLIVLAILVLPMVFTSCRAHKVASQEVTQQHSVQTVTDSATETASQVRWLSDLHLDLDSFEMVILPWPVSLDSADSCILSANDSSRQPPRQAGAIVLRGKHAALGQAVGVERNASRSSQHHVESADTSSLVVQENKTIDMTGIAEPPNMNWAIAMASIVISATIVLVIVLIVGYLRYKKK